MAGPRKFSAAVIGSSVTVLLAYAAELTSNGQVRVPVEVTIAFQGLFTYIVSVLIPDDLEE